MKFFVYYNSGSCNQGDHSSGLEEFDTLKAAKVFADDFRARNPSDGTVTVVHGSTMFTYDW